MVFVWYIGIEIIILKGFGIKMFFALQCIWFTASKSAYIYVRAKNMEMAQPINLILFYVRLYVIARLLLY